VCARCYTTHDRTTFAEIDKNDLVQEEIGCTTNPYLLPPDRRIASRIFLNCGSLLKLCQKNWQGGHTAVSSRGGVATTLFRILSRWSFGSILASINYFKALVCGIHKLGVVAAILSSDVHNFELCVVLLAQFWLSLDQRLSICFFSLIWINSCFHKLLQGTGVWDTQARRCRCHIKRLTQF
jgi:hypothetical protein